MAATVVIPLMLREDPSAATAAALSPCASSDLDVSGWVGKRGRGGEWGVYGEGGG